MMPNNQKGKDLSFDYLIIGAGIIGLSFARALLLSGGKRIAVIEKEQDVAQHASGRNSGVLHAGFYYSSDSLKAKFTKDGNLALKEYCHAKFLKINECKKVVVAKDESEIEGIFELERRGKKNGVDVKIIDEKEVYDIDPNIKTHRHALLSPSTATVDPLEVCRQIKSDLTGENVKLYFNEKYERRLDSNTIETSSGKKFSSSFIINCAGLYADRIAKDFGFAEKYAILPFKGMYLKYSGENVPVKTNVYPVPNLKNPFLGVHFTLTANREVKIGPSAMPVFFREHYGNLDGFSFIDFVEIISRQAKLFLTNSFGFRDLAWQEIKKYSKKRFIKMANDLVKSLDEKGFVNWTTPGIRAQLLNVRTLELVQDFVVEGDKNSVHILNAVSPAFTSSFPFTKWVVGKYVVNGNPYVAATKAIP